MEPGVLRVRVKIFPKVEISMCMFALVICDCTCPKAAAMLRKTIESIESQVYAV